MMLPRSADRPRPFVSVAVTGGKGGVGKTSVVVNLAVALARLGRRVGILDADFTLGNVDVLLGLAPAAHIGHLLAGEKALRDIVVDGPMGVRIIPAGSGLRDLSSLTEAEWRRLGDALDELSSDLDFLLVDTAPGISPNVTDILDGAEHVLLVTSLEPTALVDAYALIKAVSQGGGPKELGILVNAARDEAEARLVFRQLELAVSRFLDRRLSDFGYVPYDQALREAVLVQRAVVEHWPQAAASRSFRQLAMRVAGLSPQGGSGLRIVPRPPRREISQCA
jgi:flagellar biosynthesis protein FlhG